MMFFQDSPPATGLSVSLITYRSLICPTSQGPLLSFSTEESHLNLTEHSVQNAKQKQHLTK